ncbi:MAG: sorbosone dehydrogenase family protein [Bacteroidota bacterium]|nr:sorbosone dehydrogenase family protein [Bacteroidota bacterium]
MNTLNTILKVSLCLLLLFSLPAQSQMAEEPKQAKMEVAVFKPGKQDATEENIKKLKVPQGFKIEKFADNLGNARMMTTGKDGAVYVTARDEGNVILLRDTNGDGKADQRKVVAEKKDVHGITIHNNKMYLATIKEILRADIKQDGTLGKLQTLVNDLPDGGQHPNRTMKFGPDNKLYVSIGSTCNACEEPNPEHATILQFNAEGKERKVYAKGLRNTTGFDFHPATKEFWGMDHNTDWLGDDVSHEELNKIEEGAHYGWPYVFDDGKKMPHREPKEMDHEEFVKKTKLPVLMYQPHSSALSFAFYTKDQFPNNFKNDAFVTMRGSWNRENPTGYKVVRVRFDENNQPVEFEDFVTGFLLEDGKSHFGRLVGLTVHNDGSILFTDDSNGVVYRVSYDGNN